MQTRGTMSVDLMVQMFQQIPTMKATKDEVGDPLARVTELRQRTDLSSPSGRQAAVPAIF